MDSITREMVVAWLLTPAFTGFDVVTACLVVFGISFAIFGFVYFAASKQTATKEEEAEEVEEKPMDDRKDGEEWKMVLCIRTDLEMGKGKAAAQCCHATLAAVRRLEKRDSKALGSWEDEGQAKITLKCPSEDEMLRLQKAAREKGLVAECIRDAGRTQIAANSRTVLAVGPGPKSLVDSVTGHLKLY